MPVDSPAKVFSTMNLRKFCRRGELTNWGLVRIFASSCRTDSSVGLDLVPQTEGSGLLSSAAMGQLLDGLSKIL
jgi:hypothetical protein